MGNMLRVVRIFSISGNNKGLACPFKPVLCEEGYCHDCQIYLDWQKVEEKIVMCLSKVKKETKGEG